MKKRFAFYALVLVFAISGITRLSGVEDVDATPPLPEFTHSGDDEWINSEPLSVASLKGKVVLLDFWTFDCWNCYRSFPWLNSLHKRFGDDDFVIVSVHSPEFEHEKDHQRVVQKAQEFQLNHPIMIDNDFSYWRAVGNRFWPSYYIVDKQGRIRHLAIGETHIGDARAKRVEAMLEKLLAEPS